MSPAFWRVLAGRAVHSFGNAFAPIALAFAVLDLTGSATDLGLVVGARTLTNVLFLLFGGVLADRLPKSALMVTTSVASAVTQGAVAALVLTDSATVALLVALSVVNGMVSALGLPASAAILPQLVRPDLRQRANAINRMFFHGAAVLGAPLGGITVAAIGPGWGIAVDAVTFAIAAACYATVRVPRAADDRAAVPEDRAAVPEDRAAAPQDPLAVSDGPAAGRGNVVADLRLGWAEFSARAWLWSVVAGFGLVNAVWSGGLNVLGPLVADETVGRRAWGFVLAALTAGMLAGAVVAMRLRVRRLLRFGVACVLFMALPLAALGLYPQVAVLIAAAFLTGLAMEQFGVAWETTMQEHVPPGKLARVYSYDMVGSFVAIPIGQVAAGPIAALLGARVTLVGGAVLLSLAVIFMLSFRDVRHLPHRLPEADGRAVEQSAA